MIDKRTISAYTPSNTDRETRERIFVQRHQLLRRVVSWCEESMLTGNKHHLLFIGPRGCGKTHLVAMVHDRVTRNSNLADKMRIAWLGEDSVFTGLIDFALEIADELASEYPDEFHFDYRDKARALSPDDAAELILNEIVNHLGDKSILLIMENLDRAFRGLRDLGQKKWRAFLQEHGRVATVATSQQLFEDVSSRDAAFYGFFEILHLEPLSVDDARELMEKIARENEKHELVQFLKTAEGRYRVRALHHLAGGNHRMYVMLSEFLTKESLDGLVASFEELAEDLTPYFQERVRSLSPQQGRIVQSLCNASGAMTVKQVAEDTFIPERNVSKQLGDLKQKRFVVSEKRGKESLYEMAEPLMRLCLEVKKQRGKPLKLVATFLRAWYTTKSLQGQLDVESGISPNDSRSLAYRRMALQSDDAFQQAIGLKLAREFDSNMESKHIDDAMHVAEELVYADRPTGVLCMASVLREKGQFAQALEEVDEVLSLQGLSTSHKAEALYLRGIIHGEAGEHEKEIADYTAAIETEDEEEPPDDPKVWALLKRGLRYGELGEHERAIADYSVVVETREEGAELATALVNRGNRYGELGQFAEAIADFSAVIRMGKSIPVECRTGAFLNRGTIYAEQGEYEKAIADFSDVIEMQKASVGHKTTALIYRAATYRELGETEKAIVDYADVIGTEEAPMDQKVTALLNRGASSGKLGEYEKAIADYSTVIEMEVATIEQKAGALTLRGRRYWDPPQYELSVKDFAVVAKMPEASPFIRTVALFCLPVAMLPIRPIDETVESIQHAFDEGDQESSVYGGNSAEIIRMILGRKHQSWADFIEKLIPIYAENGVIGLLGNGLTTSIAALDRNGYSESQLDLWNSSWQKFGAEYEELSIPLSALDTAVRVIKTGSDRPLFDLPLEIREIVRPLLKNTLAEK